MDILGIDIGGSGIKAALVDIDIGLFITERVRIPTPQKGEPEKVAKVIYDIVHQFNYDGIVGVGFPGPIVHDTALLAANIDEKWVGKNVREVLKSKIDNELVVINDADAAGLAEMKYGAGINQNGTVLVLTLGTGIGTAVFFNGLLLPNTELGHIEIRGKDSERRATAVARVKKKLSWKKWAANLEEYINVMEKYIYPDLVIIGGGISKDSDRFLPYIKSRAKVVPAKMLNKAGIIGAARYAFDYVES